MRKTIYIVLVTAILSFLGGLWWEVSQKGYLNFSRRSHVEVTVLAPEGIFPDEFVAEFNKKENVLLKVTHAKSTKSLLQDIFKDEASFTLIVFPSYLSDSFSYSEYFVPLNNIFDSTDLKKLQNKVSVDFLSLGKDPENKYLMPLSWGVNGWLLPKSSGDTDLSLATFLNTQDRKAKLFVIPDPMEFFGIFNKLKPAVQTWVGIGNASELEKELHDVKTKISTVAMALPDSIRQVSNGELTADQVDRFRLPEEKAHLWIQYIAVRKSSSRPKDLADIIQLLYSQGWASVLAKSSKIAHASNSVESIKDFPEYLKPSFLRRLPLARIDMISAHEAYEPTFMDFLQKSYPKMFEP